MDYTNDKADDPLAGSAAWVAELLKKNGELTLASARWKKQVKVLTANARQRIVKKATLQY